MIRLILALLLLGSGYAQAQTLYNGHIPTIEEYNTSRGVQNLTPTKECTYNRYVYEEHRVSYEVYETTSGVRDISPTRIVEQDPNNRNTYIIREVVNGVPQIEGAKIIKMIGY